MKLAEIKKIIDNKDIKAVEINKIIEESFNNGDITVKQRSKCNIRLIKRENQKHPKVIKEKPLIKDVKDKSSPKIPVKRDYSPKKPQVEKCLCNTCGKGDCYNRRKYKPHCSQYREVKPDEYHKYPQNHGYTGNGCRRPPNGSYFH